MNAVGCACDYEPTGLLRFRWWLATLYKLQQQQGPSFNADAAKAFGPGIHLCVCAHA